MRLEDHPIWLSVENDFTIVYILSNFFRINVENLRKFLQILLPFYYSSLKVVENKELKFTFSWSHKWENRDNGFYFVNDMPKIG